MRLLVITRHPPLPDWDGAGSYLHDLVTYFAGRGVPVEIAWSQPPRLWRRHRPLHLPRAITRVCSLQMPGALAIGPWRWMTWGTYQARFLQGIRRLTGLATASSPLPASAIATRQTAGWSQLPSPAEMKFFRRRIRAFKPDAILANFCWLAPAFEYAGGARTAVLAHDVSSQHLGLYGNAAPPAAGIGETPNPAHPDGERELLAKAQAILAISEDDAAVFRAWLPHHHTVLTPKAARCSPTSSRGVIPGRCIFVGGFNEPNREGLAWLLNEVWPLVLSRHTQATLHIFGNIASTVSVPPPGVTLRGRVDQLADAYAEAQIALVPLLRGSGMKIKLVEAAGHGKACVTTSVGLQGLSFLRDQVVTADQAGDFAAGINHLLGDPGRCRTLGRSLLRQVAAHLSSERSYGPALNALFARPGSPSTSIRPAVGCAPAQPPLVSVVLPVYNAARHLNAAVNSILAQTWRDFELIAIDDGSTDGSKAILEKLAAQDARIRILSRPNTGLIGALNDGLALARGEFIARMDADDEAAPTRMAAQVHRLQAEPGLVALGSAVTLMDAAGHPVKAHPRPTGHAEIERALLDGDGGAMIHPSVTLRASAVREAGGYRPVARHVEDLDFFLRLARIGTLANLPSAELRYRVHADSINFTGNAGRHATKLAVLREAWTVRGMEFDPARFPDGFARYADRAGHHRDWAVTALAYGDRHVAVGHGWRSVGLRPFDPASWRALRYALTAPLRPSPDISRSPL